MAGMTKKAGTELATGIASINGMTAQSGSKAAGGELKVYRNEDGDVLSIYLDDDHSEVKFEGLLASSQVTGATGKKIGDQFSALGVTGYLTAWEVQWTNDDVSKVSGSLRNYTIPASGGSTQTNT